MGTREKENTTTGFIEQPTESPTGCPSSPQPCECGLVVPAWDDAPMDSRVQVRLICSTCGTPLAPVEITLDLGDGPELMCDACLGISN